MCVLEEFRHDFRQKVHIWALLWPKPSCPLSLSLSSWCPVEAGALVVGFLVGQQSDWCLVSAWTSKVAIPHQGYQANSIPAGAIGIPESPFTFISRNLGFKGVTVSRPWGSDMYHTGNGPVKLSPTLEAKQQKLGRFSSCRAALRPKPGPAPDYRP